MKLEILKPLHKLFEFSGQSCNKGHSKLRLGRDREISSFNLLVILFLVSRGVPEYFERDGVGLPYLQFSNNWNDSFDLLILLQEEYQGILAVLILVTHNGKIARYILSLCIGWQRLSAS